ncbi:DNA-(apurinic or apyrimidinic site) lyase [Anaerobranca californiensis DSM 14826]|jgi:formamidopyrimidine-DNA glycosylase|uniref:Formamidopyrimidine-DNA glycosylase n=1 Tax=Anaerobranca californiensis DSM 14826 TaxID=1120989 RepID=A0A1M6PQN4_9FIRM|nr:DNA-formamidopyrimidine glycosylase [Anaerobranca californiensis]SHK10289.1 DNA-(apurinic or apyrimidinic site) lyase [Anaerobranca californiensis DSM 14826]
MPELPEVETIVRGLKPKLEGNRILEVEVYNENTIKNPESVKEFKERITGKKIIEVKRRGKYILFILEDFAHVIIHLRMTGQLIYSEKQLSFSHLRLEAKLSKGFLYFNDIRKFGTISLLAKEDLAKEKGFWTLGVEPLGESFGFEYLKSKLVSSKPIKNLLLDQRVIAGLGNIYVDESLFFAGISPFKPAKTLSPEEISKLVSSIKFVLTKGIENKGTSFSDFVDSYGGKGTNQNFLQVYGRGGEQCRICGKVLAKGKIAGRTTVFCLHCQK